MVVLTRPLPARLRITVAKVEPAQADNRPLGEMMAQSFREHAWFVG
jgi:hypothetical protein